MFHSEFRRWVEVNETKKKLVFLDLNETLITELDDGWLKNCAENHRYYVYMATGEEPHPDVKTIKHEGELVNIFPRNMYIDFLKVINSFADAYILTHSKKDWADKACAATGISKYVKEIYSTRDLEPNHLGHKFMLDKTDWILLDNMMLNSVQVCNKLRILGMCFPEAGDPREEAQIIMKLGKDHFINIEDWWPTVNNSDDMELMRSIPEIRDKLKLKPVWISSKTSKRS